MQPREQAFSIHQINPQHQAPPLTAQGRGYRSLSQSHSTTPTAPTVLKYLQQFLHSFDLVSHLYINYFMAALSPD